MAKPESTPSEQWVAELETLSKKLHAHAKGIVASAGDPFAQREQLDRTVRTLAEMDLERLKGPISLRKDLDTQCVEAAAEFWQRFSVAAGEAGWEVHGSTDRRLVSRAFFVEQKGDVVTVDGLSGKYSPHVPRLIHALRPHLAGVSIDRMKLQEFVDVLAQAYDLLGGHGDIALESVFRQCVVLTQPAAFWIGMEPTRFLPLSRPAFRWRLSAVLAEKLVPRDGREIRLAPTVNRKEFWELFSPAEERVVQVGRIAFLSK